MARSRALVLFAILSLVAGCATPPADDVPDGDASDTVRERLAEEWPLPIEMPTQVRPLADGSFLVASLDGRVLHVSSQGETLSTLIDIDVHPFTGEYGLLGMALHPDHTEQPLVYVFFTNPRNADNVVTQTIARFVFDGQTASPLEPVVVDIPGNPVCCHNGGRLAFGPDGMLYATLGDQLTSARAQNPMDWAGSILRFTPEGAIPHDNPHEGSPVVVTGIRNAYGLTFDPEWGMVVTDNGPSVVDGPPGYDELSLLAIGDNAGWPAAWGDVEVPGSVAPIWHSGDARVPPTGVVVPRGSAVAEVDGMILFCDYNAHRALMVDPSAASPEAVTVFEPCTFDVAQDALGRLVFAAMGALWVVG